MIEGYQTRKAVCSYCGTANDTLNLRCEGCGESIYQGLRERLYEYNRRLREGLKHSDHRVIAIMRQAIIHTVDLVGSRDGWSVDGMGYAKESERRKIDTRKTEYDEDDIQAYMARKG